MPEEACLCLLGDLLICFIANVFYALLQGEFIKIFMGEVYKDTDPLLNHSHCVCKGEMDFCIGTICEGWVWDGPMGG